MRRSVALMVLALAVAIAGVVYCVQTITRHRDDVTYQQQTLSGDPAAAQGLRLSFDHNSGSSMRWQTELTPGQAPHVQVSYAPMPGARVQGYRYPDEYIPQAYFGNYSSVGLDLETAQNGQYQSYMPIIQAVADRTNPGKKHSEYLYASEYLTTIPDLAVSINHFLMSYEQSITDEAYNADILALSQVFPIPPPEDLRVNISVEKNDKGDIVGIDLEMSKIRRRALIFHRAENDTQLYLAFSTVDLPDEYAYDLTQFKQGYGVYGLSRPAPRKQTSWSGSYLNFENILPLDQATQRPFHLLLSESGQQLYVFTVEQEQVVLTVVDTKTYHILQTTPLFPLDPDLGEPLVFVQNDDLLLLTRNSYLYLQHQPDNTLRPILSGDVLPPLPNGYTDSVYLYELLVGCLYGDGRLYLAYELDGGIYLAVLDEAGMQYHGRFIPSLKQIITDTFWDGPSPIHTWTTYLSLEMA